MKRLLFRLCSAGLLVLPLAVPAPAAVPIANTGYITAPALVSAGMTGVLACVPAQAGATYLWTVSGGTIPGVREDAAVVWNAGAAGTATLQCAVTLSGVTTDYTQAVPVQAPVPVTSGGYGSGLGADDLANTVLGGPELNRASYRFQALHGGILRGVRVFFIWSTQKAGYQAGEGGTIRVDLEADSGLPDHLPTGQPLATVTYGNIISQNVNYPELVFPQAPTLTGGAYYHLVFSNVDPQPKTNFISLDSLYCDAQVFARQPSVNDASAAVLLSSDGGRWSTRQGFTPILELDYSSGSSQGFGYVEVWSTNPKLISGNAQVREAFTVSGLPRPFTRIRVRLRRVAGASPLTVRVEEADGTLIEQGTVPASQVLAGVSTWVAISFPLSQTLAPGVAYHLVLSAPADTEYSAYPLRKGLDKGFSDYAAFADGHAEYTTTGAGGWTGWDMWGTPDLKTGDLQFLFVP